MSETPKGDEINDVLTSIRRLLSADGTPKARSDNSTPSSDTTPTAQSGSLWPAALDKGRDGQQTKSLGEGEVPAALVLSGALRVDPTPDQTATQSRERSSLEPVDLAAYAARAAADGAPEDQSAVIAFPDQQTQRPIAQPAAETRASTTSDDIAAEELATEGAEPESSDESIHAQSSPTPNPLAEHDVLRELVAAMVREELSDALRERSPMDLRNIVREEIARALVLRDDG